MSNQRTHYVTTTDGVTIGGTVHGQGPPLVFLQGAVGDGDLDWNRVVEHLTGRFTCHLPSMRGRGLSGDHPDSAPVGSSRTTARTSTASVSLSA
jgi:pimeloyl-ACP methyl ester carboxylesterase